MLAEEVDAYCLALKVLAAWVVAEVLLAELAALATAEQPTQAEEVVLLLP